MLGKVISGKWKDINGADILVVQKGSKLSVRHSDGRTADGLITEGYKIWLDYKFTNANGTKCCRALVSPDSTSISFPDNYTSWTKVE
jgi:hypothetical protein